MEPIRTIKDYFLYTSILAGINELIEYYNLHGESKHDGGRVSDIKKKLLKTKLRSLNAKGGGSISIDDASDQQINGAFSNEFSKKDKNMPEYLKTVTKPWYETRIKNYKDRLNGLLPGTAALNDLIAAEYLAEKSFKFERARDLHESIENRLNSCSQTELKEVWNAHKPNVAVLIHYSAYKNQ